MQPEQAAGQGPGSGLSVKPAALLPQTEAGCAGTGGPEVQAATQAALASAAQASSKGALCEWRPWQDGLQLSHQHDVARLCWHTRGDYFSSVCPLGNTRVRNLVCCQKDRTSRCHGLLSATVAKQQAAESLRPC